MDPIRETLAWLDPVAGTEEEWNAACERLEAYLLALGVEGSLRRHQLILALLAEAIAQHREDPARSPTQVLLSLTLARVRRWLLGNEDPAIQDRWEEARRLLILYLTGGPEAWPKAVLERKAPLLPKEVASSLLPGPEVVLTHMASRPIDYGPLATIAKEAWEDISWKDILTALAFWTLVFLVSYLVFIRHG
jgi:hypothetical protein